MPYPFNHLISISSDVDQETPEHGAAIYRLMNRKLGLPIAGSTWLGTNDLGSEISGLFTGQRTLNRTPSGVENLPVFALLLRQWHRGALDHIHSWHVDGLYALRNELAPAVKLASERVAAPVTPTPLGARSAPYRNLRLFFDARPPDDLTLLVVDEEGRKAFAGVPAVQRGRRLQVKTDKEHWIDLIFDPDVAVPANGSKMEADFSLALLKEIELVSASCASGCDVNLLRIERDVFSRQTVSGQLPWLEAWNIRPVVSTAHGGFSLTQVLWSPDGPPLKLSPAGPFLSDPAVVKELRGYLTVPTNAAYTADLAARIGIEHIWPYAGNWDHKWDETRVPLTPVPKSDGGPSFYYFSRSRSLVLDTSSLEQFRTKLHDQLPTLTNDFIDGVYCTKSCGDDQGAMLPIWLAAVLERAKEGKSIDQVAYTHIGTGDLDWVADTNEPLRPILAEWLRKLARNYYNFDGNVEANQRVWVPPVSVAARYRLLIDHVAPHVSTDGNTVTIKSWRDDVTRRIVPDPHAGTRDLHGLTIYVPEPAAAQVMVDGRSVESFTVNPPDDTGKGSITLVDDHLPTLILGELPVGRLGLASSVNAVFEDAAWPLPNVPSSGRRAKITLDNDGSGWVTVRPRQLVLDNNTHFKLVYRKFGSEVPKGRVFVEFVLQDGAKIMLAEGEDKEPPGDGGSGWWIPVHSGSDKVTRIVAVHDLVWSSDRTRHSPMLKRPPLPNGPIAAIRLGIEGGAAGESVEWREFTALRASGNGVSPDGKVMLAGRVGRNGAPQANVAVTVLGADGSTRTTVTDDDGLYFVTGLKKSIPIYVGVVSDQGAECGPVSATAFDMRRDYAEADIDLDDCQELPLPVQRDISWIMQGKQIVPRLKVGSELN